MLDTELKGRGRNPEGLEVVGLSARTEVDRRDFGLTWNQALETGGFVVGDEIKISLDLELIRS